MKLLWIYSLFSYAMWTVSLMALLATSELYEHATNTFLPGAPRATADLNKVFLPPLLRMQTLAFILDTMTALYYVY